MIKDFDTAYRIYLNGVPADNILYIDVEEAKVAREKYRAENPSVKATIGIYSVDDYAVFFPTVLNEGPL